MTLSRNSFAGLEILEGREVPAVLWPGSKGDKLLDEPKGPDQVVSTPTPTHPTVVAPAVVGNLGGTTSPGFFNPSPWTPPIGGPRG